MIVRAGLRGCAILVLSAIGACTQLPVAEFGAYRSAFDQARSAGEQVVLDWHGSNEQWRAIREKPPPLQAGKRKRAPWEPKPNEGTAGDVAARMEAWKIVADYNDLLTALAEGRKADELGAEIDGLANSLEGFPWEAMGVEASRIVASVGGVVGPAVGLVKMLATEAKREADRRKFLEAVEAAAPLIRGLIQIHRDDVANFEGVRRGLYELRYLEPRSAVDRNIRGLRALIRQHGDPRNIRPSTPELQALAGLQGEAIEALGKIYDIDPARIADAPVAPEATGAYAKEEQDQFEAHCRAILAGTVQMQALDVELDAYHDLLARYLDMLDAMEAMFVKLRTSAAEAKAAPPDFDRLAELVLEIREAAAVYRNAR